ncbi:MAG: branched-chain amino acid ABC transporter substrate-binding protein [Desulfonatronovibrionaceae bacterium]
MPVLIGFLCVCCLVLSSCSSENSAPYVCQDQLGCLIIEKNDPVKLVSMQALSGPLATLGQEYARALELAVADGYEQIHGHPVTVTFEDSGCSREGGFIAAKKTVADPDIAAVHGTSCSISSVPAAEILSQAGMVLVSGASTAPSLTQSGGEKGQYWQPGFFRTVPNDQDQAVAAAHFVSKHLNLSRAAVVSDGDPYTTGLVSAFSREFASLGGEVVFEDQVNRGDKNMKPILEAVSWSQADILFMPLFPEEGRHILEQKDQVPGMQDMIFLGADGLLNAVFVQSVGPEAKGLYLTGPHIPENQEYLDLQQRYADISKEFPQGSYITHNYDAAVLLLRALERSAHKRANGSLVIGRQKLRDEIAATRNMHGITGTISCNDFGDCGVSRYKLVRLDEPGAEYEKTHKNIIATYTAP